MNLKKIGRGLSGFSAGVSGQLPAFSAGLRAEEDQRRRERALAVKEKEDERLERIRTFSSTVGVAQSLIDQGRTNSAAELFLSSNDQDLIGVGKELLSPGTRDDATNDVFNFYNKALSLGHIKKEETGVHMQEMRRYESLLARAKKTGAEADIKRAQEFAVMIGADKMPEERRMEKTASIEAKKGRDKAKVARLEGMIETGSAAADTVPTINRIVTLLGDTKTGGWHHAANKLNILFGTQSADEAELTRDIGVIYMKQIKPMFGGAPSLKETEMLQSIEAGFGKSTEGNIRMLKQALKLAKDRARRGKAAAKEMGHNVAFDEIERSLNLNLNITDDEPEKDEQRAIPAKQPYKVVF